ncbi:hypothetical protein LWI28_006457 [Acer negundo]|uniref:Uncharacterized protein n=1 Tax=Acer negundo TaxID=4023 RepID=A0AAD5NX88_ACENE|nr:hypothetical protein LWI28_006457 [Acer negundo]
MGIPLLIEEDTRNKSRLDMGRLLISIPIDSKCPKKIKVQDRSRLFEISIVVDKTPVDQIWINKLLGLWNGEDDSNSNSSPEHEWFGKPSVKVGAQVPGCQQNYGFSDKSHSHGDAKVKEALDKGKKVAQKKFKARKVVPRLCNTAVILEKKRVGVFSEGEISFSSSEFSTRLRYPVGECSKKGLNKIESGPASSWVAKRPNGLPSNSLDSYEDPIILDPVCEPDQFLGRVLPEIDNQRDHEPIHLAVDIGLLQCVEGMKVVNGGRSSQTNKRKIARKEGGIRTHDMRTRNKKTAEVLS